MSDTTLGFRTRASQIQKELENLKTDLDGVSIQWSNLVENAAKGASKADKGLGEISKSRKIPEQLFMLQLSLYHYWSLMEVIGVLGQGVTLIHKDLAKLEKTIKELKLAKK